MNGADAAARRWLAKAENDLLNIRNNLHAALIPWDTVCFHAQQAAEKYLKAFLVAQGALPPRSHDLIALLALCVEFTPDLTALETSCRSLAYFGTASRYPDDIYEPDEEDGRQAFAASLRVQQLILTHLPRSPDPA
ncbi:HEPN domain-containing protein [Desulfovibrio sp. TomC]|uniref:HEPN domain-containing protein n=1 Tax=Desulfovibrio sp. TomC TaxID=1562888 RepID=UPI000573D9DB|nr:HEPN domain-containing protein [Desulfovibrio sp. TomC]KHK00539.1 HEPN domain-containing nucleotidyltransferase [Desulfovibrio sp. TomC]